MSTEGLLSDYPELRPFVLSDVQVTGVRIGAGAYGSVEEVVVLGAVCAAKKIHDLFQDPRHVPPAAIRRATAQFVRECQLLSTLRHPNIVQFLGLCFLPGSQLPALVMERLDTSLHDLLEPEIDPPPPPNAPKPFFPLSLKCSILHNVASGLAYLHERSPPVIHRDLSARNVLLNSGMVAKIADLGVARIVPRRGAAATMTKGPGAIVYMPPEAMEDKPEEEEEVSKAKYDTSIDVFSFGVVAIFTLCQTFPDKLLAPTYREHGKLIGRTELERRGKYIKAIYSQLQQNHPLVLMIKGCLDFPEDRPNTREVLVLLEEARAEMSDRQISMNKLELLQSLHTQPRDQSAEEDLQSRVQELQSYVQAKDMELIKAQQELRQKEEQLSKQEAELKRVGEVIRRDKQQLRQKEEELQSSQALASEFQESLQLGDSKTHGEKLIVECHINEKVLAPRGMARGSATTDGRFAYFTPWDSTSVYKYEYSTEKWEELPSCPYFDSGLVVIDSELTAVGGWRFPRFSNKLLTLKWGEWGKEYPPMNTGCTSPALVTTADGEYLIVIGGNLGVKWTSRVELFHVKLRMWYKLKDLPEPLPRPSATICGDLIQVIGSDGRGYSSAFQVESSSDQSITTPILTWKRLPPSPLMQSTSASVCGQLLLIGGVRNGPLVDSIHQLVGGKWLGIGSMDIARKWCLVVNPSPDKIIILGGWGALKSIEECTVVFV